MQLYIFPLLVYVELFFQDFDLQRPLYKSGYPWLE